MTLSNLLRKSFSRRLQSPWPARQPLSPDEWRPLFIARSASTANNASTARSAALDRMLGLAWRQVRRIIMYSLISFSSRDAWSGGPAERPPERDGQADRGDADEDARLDELQRPEAVHPLIAVDEAGAQI